MILKDTTSCAMQEITGLYAFTHNPKGAMQAFCRLVFDEKGRAQSRFGKEFCNSDSLYSFYLFSAAVSLNGKEHYNYPPYAKEFSKFILDNGLGEVLESPIRQNKTFHTTHGNQIYIWTIDAKAVKAWWDKNKAPADVKVIEAKPALNEVYQLEDLSYDDL